MARSLETKSFNEQGNDDIVRSLVKLAVSLPLLAFLLPQIIQHVAVPLGQVATPILDLFGVDLRVPSVMPAWGVLTGPLDATRSVLYGGLYQFLLGACFLAVALHEAYVIAHDRAAVHDGTWLGPKRVPGDPGGTARLISSHRELKKVLVSWDGQGAPARSGLPVAYFDGRFWLVDYVNLLIFGAPGCGKTRRVLIPAVCGHVVAGDSVFCLDPKGEIRDYTEDFAKEHGYRVVRVMIDDPVRSPDTINPLSAAVEFAEAGEVDDVIAEVASIAKTICPTKSKTSPHFDDSARSLCEGLMIAVVLSPDIAEEEKSIATVNAIASFAGSDGSTGLTRIRELARALPDDHPAKSKLSQVANTGDEEASSIISTFVSKMNDYVDARVSRMLWRSTFRFSDLAREKTIVYLSFTSANGNYGRLVTTLVSNAIRSLRHEAARQGGHLSRECYLILEEMAQMERIETIYADAGIMRGEGIHLLLVLQEKSQLLTKYSKEEAASLTGCCDDTLVLSVNELDVARELTGKMGTYPARMQTSNKSKSHGAHDSSSAGTSTSSQKRDLITPDELLRWGPDIGNLLIGHGGVYALPSPALEDTFVNEMLGLGDRAYNDRLRADKARSRDGICNPVAPIWLPKGQEADDEANGPSIVRKNYNPLKL